MLPSDTTTPDTTPPSDATDVIPHTTAMQHAHARFTVTCNSQSLHTTSMNHVADIQSLSTGYDPGPSILASTPINHDPELLTHTDIRMDSNSISDLPGYDPGPSIHDKSTTPKTCEFNPNVNTITNRKLVTSLKFPRFRKEISEVARDVLLEDMD